MRDNLDLQELRERANLYTSQARRIRNRALIFILGGLIIFAWLYLQTRNPLGQIYTSRGDAVEPYYGDAVIDLQTAEDGTIWMQVAHIRKMIHATDDEWNTYYDRDIENCCSNFKFDGVFAVYGNNVWAQSDKHLAYFDGITWSVEPNYFESSTSLDLAVNSQGVFAIDAQYVFHIKTNESWTSDSLAYLYSENFSSPIFINVADVMYLHFNGLRRFNGDSWNFVAALPEDSVFLGNNDTDIWFESHDALVVYHSTSNELQFFSHEDMGLSPESSIHTVFYGKGGETYFATDSSIYQLNDDSWSFVKSIDSLYGINKVGVLADGWVITSLDVGFAGTPAAESYYTAYLFIPFLAPIIILIGIMLVWYRPSQKYYKARIEPFREFIKITTEDAEFEEGDKIAVVEAKAGRSPFARLIIFVVIIMFTPVILSMLKTPPQLTLLIAPIIGFVYLISPTIRSVANLKDQSEETRHSRRYLIRFFAIVVVMLALIPILISVISSVFPFIENPAVLLLGVFPLAMIAWYISVKRKPRRVLPKALARADYEHAIKDSTKLTLTTGSLINRGVVYTYAGNYQDAVRTYIKVLKKTANLSTGFISISLTGLAYAKDRLGNFEEALPLYQMAIKMYPESPIPYRALANAYNINQIHPDRAVEISNEMMAHLEDNKFSTIIEIARDSIIKMTHALALANIGQFDEVQSLIKQAESGIDRDFIPGLASFHHLHARILFAMDKRDEAIALLNKAIEIDPKGDAGQLAKSLLDKTLATKSES